MPTLSPILALFIPLTSILLAQGQGANPPPSDPYRLIITPHSGIQTCQPASFAYTVTPTLPTFEPIALTVVLESTDGSVFKILTQAAALGEGTWTWLQVTVPPGQYDVSMFNTDADQTQITGTSNPFVINAVDTSCLSGGNPPTSSPPPNSSLPPSTPTGSTFTPASQTSGGASTLPVSTSNPTSSSSSSSSTPVLPTGIATASSHSTVGLKAGVSVAVVAVVFSTVAALYWMFVTRRRRRHDLPPQSPQRQNMMGGFGPRYNGLASRDERYPSDAKPLTDPLGRSFPGPGPAGGNFDSYSRSEFLDEKSAQTASANGAISSNGATLGHDTSESLSALGFMPSQPPTAFYPQPVPLVTRTASHSTSVTSHDGLNSHDSPTETSDTHGSGSAPLPPKRAARKPVPAYTDVPRRNSSDKRKRGSGGSGTSFAPASYSSSLSDIPPQPSRLAPTAPATLNHKGSFGEKPMSHVLMPDMPLSQV